MQHVGAGLETPDVPQPQIPQQLQVLHSHINQPSSFPAQLIVPFQANPIVPAPQAVQPLLDLPIQAAGAINPNLPQFQAAPLLPPGPDEARAKGRPKR